MLLPVTTETVYRKAFRLQFWTISLGFREEDLQSLCLAWSMSPLLDLYVNGLRAWWIVQSQSAISLFQRSCLTIFAPVVNYPISSRWFPALVTSEYVLHRYSARAVQHFAVVALWNLVFRFKFHLVSTNRIPHRCCMMDGMSASDL